LFIFFVGIISWKGVIYGILSSACVSLNSIYTKKVLSFVDNSVLTLNLYNNINASVLFIPIMFLIGEMPNHIFVGQMLEVHFWTLMVLGGFCGVAIGFVTALQIQVHIAQRKQNLRKTQETSIFSDLGNISTDAQHFWYSESMCPNHLSCSHLQ
jgi:drug/metabolite transporter (DMT)-like permease